MSAGELADLYQMSKPSMSTHFNEQNAMETTFSID